MKPIQPPAMSRLRRRPDLTPLPIPKPDPPRAVPLPLPPTASAQCSVSSSSSSSASSAPSSSSSLHPPQQFSPNPSDFERVRRIGSGNGGTVYMVVHRPTSKVYALKVIYGNHEESVRHQILREIHILGTANNPYVVHCHGTFVQGGEIQILLEYMDRGSLDSRKPIAEPVLSSVASQVLMGLAYLHSLKIVHRDIKPSNLLINDRNQVKIADFGVSRILAQTMDPCNSSVGTIAYMSPERINTDLNHGAYDGYAGDIWSLGVTMLECYLGRFPFSIGKQGDWASLVVAICYSQPPEAPPGASSDFRDFIGRCLQREPSKRWTAAQLLVHPFVRQSALASAGGQVLQQPHSSAHGSGGQVLQQPHSSAHG